MNNEIYTNYYSNFILSNSNKNRTTLQELKQCTKKTFNKQDNQIKQCPISLEDFKDGESILELPCGHYFCEDKIKEWLNKNTTCPVCRFNLRKKKPEIRQQLDFIIDHYSLGLLEGVNGDAVDYFEIY